MTSLEEKSDGVTKAIPPSNESSFQLSMESLIDCLIAFHSDIQDISPPTNPMNLFFNRFTPLVQQIENLRVKLSDFQTVKVFGRGAFGEVRLVRCLLNGEYYAMKVLRKTNLLNEREGSFYKEERDALIQIKSQWISQLHFALQDPNYLYLVMEYIPGGSLLNHLFKKDKLSEEEAKFYIFELVVAIQDIHDSGFCHRDIKPENILIDLTGHIKVTDFGSCARVDSRGRVYSKIPVGTPEYISPEVLLSQEKNTHFGRECDWWSVGIVLYELLFGEVPFYSDSLVELYGMIINHKKNFKFPPEITISSEAKDLIKRLITDKTDRLGSNGGSRQILSHPFFKGLNFDDPKKATPFWVPTISDPSDLSNFEELDQGEDSPIKDKKSMKKAPGFTGEQLPFIGFTYNRYFRYQGFDTKPVMSLPKTFANEKLSSRKSMDSTASDISDHAFYLEKIRKHEQEKEECEQQIGSLKNSNESLIKKLSVMEETNRLLTIDLKSLHSSLSKNVSVSQLEEVEKEKLRLEFELKAITESYHQIKKEKQELASQVATLDRNIIEEQQRCSNFSKKASEAISQLEKFKRQNENSAKESSSYELKATKLEQLLKERDDTIQRLSDTISQNKKEFQQMKKEFENQIKELQDLIINERKRRQNIEKSTSQQDLDSQTKIDDLIKQLQKSNKLIKEKEEIIMDINMKKNDLFIEVESLGEEKKKLKNLIASKDSSITSLEKAVSKYEEKLQSVNSSSNRLQEVEREKKIFQEKVVALQGLLSDNEKMTLDMKQNNANLIIELNEMKEKLSEYSINMIKTLAEKEDLIKKYEELSKSRTTPSSSSEFTPSPEESKLRKDLSLAHFRIEELQSKLDDEIMSREMYIQSKKDAIKSKVNLEMKLEDMEDKNSLLKETIEETKKLLDVERRNVFDLEMKIASLESSARKLEMQYLKFQEKDKDFEALFEESEKIKHEKKLLMVEVQKLKNELEIKDKSVSDLQQKLISQDTITRQSNSEREKLLETLEQIRTDLEDTQIQLETEIKKSEVLKKEKYDLEKELQDLEDLSLSIERKHHNKKEELEKEITSLNQTMQEKINFEQEERIKAEENLATVVSEKEEISQNLLSVKEKYQIEISLNKSNSEKINSLMTEKNELEILYAQLESSNRSNTLFISSLEDKCKSFEIQLKQEVLSKTDLSQTILEQSHENNSLKEQIKRYSEENNKQIMENRSLTEEVSILRKEIENIQKKKRTEEDIETPGKTKEKQMKKDFSKLQQNLEIERKKVEKLEASLDQARLELYEMKKTQEARVEMMLEEKDKEKDKEKENHTGANVLTSIFRKKSVKSLHLVSLSDHLDGYLELRQSKGAHHKWKKCFVSLHDAKLSVFEKGESKAMLIFDLKEYMFIVREATVNHIRNVENEELELIFGIWYKTKAEMESKESTDTLVSTSKSNSIMSKTSLESATPTSPTFLLPEKNEKKEDVLEEIKVEKQKQEALLKMMHTFGENKDALKQFNQSVIQTEKLKDLLISIPSDSKSRSFSLHKHSDEVVEYLGHEFKMKHYNIPTWCHQCHESLKQPPLDNQGLACSKCHLICHSNCLNSVKTGCKQVMETKNVTPNFFKASDEYEKRKWLAHLQSIRDSFLNM